MSVRVIVAGIILLLIVGSAAAGERRVGNPLFVRLLAALLGDSVPEIPVSGAKRRSDCLFFDAREPAEFAVSHIAGARPVGYEGFDAAGVADVAPDACLVVCRSRSPGSCRAPGTATSITSTAESSSG